MQKKLYTLLLLCLIRSQLMAQAQLSTFNYWFDNDYANNISTTLSTTHSTINTPVSTNILSDGIHTIKTRFKDVNGLWSAVVSELFIKENNVVSNIVEYEYWFDNAYLFKHQVQITPTQYINLNNLKDLLD